MVYTTVQDVITELGGHEINSTTNPNESEVEEWIVQAKSEIDARTNMTFENTTITDEEYDWYNQGDYILRLKYSPIISVSNLFYNGESAGETPSWVEKTENTHFYVYKDTGEIEFIPSKFSPLSGKKRFKITYSYGYENVPAMVKRLATIMVARRVIAAVINSQASEKLGNVAIGTISVSDPSMFSVNHYETLGKEIELLFSKLIGDFKSFRVIRDYNA